MIFRKVHWVHFVGIGGIGMSGIAELLLNLGFKVTGSDMNLSDNVTRIRKLGIDVDIGHDPSNVGNADVLVYSSAVPAENPEIVRARQKGISIIKRAEMLGELINVKPTSIAVGGTHGKTSTSSMIGTILSSAKKDPTLVVGGLVHMLNTNAKLGAGEIIVVEADEFDRSFLALKPTIAIVTNIELEHTDCYESLDDLKNAFIQFCQSVPFYGEIILCIDSSTLREIMPKLSRPVTTYGRSRDADFRAENLQFSRNRSTYSVFREKEKLGDIKLNVPGEHNVMNSLCAVVLGLDMGLSFQDIQTGINAYQGVRRRFEIKGNYQNIMVVDDYAHHPTEIRVTIDAAKNGWDRRIISIFQPHLFSRTQAFFREFADALFTTDILIITDIYPAREIPIPGITAELIVNEVINQGHKNVHYVPDLEDLNPVLDNIVKDNDMVLTMGAGSIWRYSEKYANHLEKITTGVRK